MALKDFHKEMENPGEHLHVSATTMGAITCRLQSTFDQERAGLGPGPKREQAGAILTGDTRDGREQTE